MSYSISIPRGLRCFYQGSLAVEGTSVGLPAAALAVPNGRDIEIQLGVETNDVRYQLDGSDASATSMPLRADGYLRLPGMDACSKLRLIQNSAAATVRIQSFCMPL